MSRSAEQQHGDDVGEDEEDEGGNEGRDRRKGRGDRVEHAAGRRPRSRLVRLIVVMAVRDTGTATSAQQSDSDGPVLGSVLFDERARGLGDVLVVGALPLDRALLDHAAQEAIDQRSSASLDVAQTHLRPVDF